MGRWKFRNRMTTLAKAKYVWTVNGTIVIQHGLVWYFGTICCQMMNACEKVLYLFSYFIYS